MSKHSTAFFRTAILLAMLCLSGCASKSQTARFYLLSPQELTQFDSREGLVGVYPVRVPDYLDRAQIVTRTGENTLDLNEFHRWAEPLKVNMTSILVKNLSHLLQNDRVVKSNLVFGLPVRALVGVDVLRFDGVLGGEVVLSGSWGIFSDDGKEALAMKGFSFQEQTASETHTDYVAAMSRILAELSRGIAEELERIL